MRDNCKAALENCSALHDRLIQGEVDNCEMVRREFLTELIGLFDSLEVSFHSDGADVHEAGTVALQASIVSRIFDKQSALNSKHFQELAELYGNLFVRCRRFWKNQIWDIENLEKLFSVEKRILVGKLLLDQQNFLSSFSVFKNIMDEKNFRDDSIIDITDEDGIKTAILMAYACEGCITESGDAEFSKIANDLLSEIDQKFRSVDKNDLPTNWRDLWAEVQHCRGHVAIASYLYVDNSDSAQAINGTYYLEKAARINPAYLSCFTSCFSELGDHDECVRASNRHIKNETDSILSDIDGKTVRSEVWFYLANAHINLCNFREAELCFKEFLEVNPTSSLDSKNHVELFRIKMALKRSFLSELDSDRIQQLNNDIKSLKFVSHASSRVQREAEKTAEAIQFLSKFSHESLIDFLEISPTGDRAGGAVRLFDASVDFLRVIIHDEIDLVSGLIVQLYERGVRGYKAPLKQLNDRLRQRLVERDLGKLDLSIKLSSMAKSSRPAGIEIDSVLNAGKILAGESNISRRILLGDGIIESVLIDESKHKLFSELIIVLLAFFALKRFIHRDQYVFALAPCQESPALHFQNPAYDLHEIA